MKSLIEKWKSLTTIQKVMSIIIIIATLFVIFHPKIFGTFLRVYKNHLFIFILVFVVIPLYLFFFPVSLPKFQKSEKLLVLPNIKKTSKKLLISVGVLLTLLVGIRLVWAFQKKSFHVDEWLSIRISNINEAVPYGCKEYAFDYDREYTGTEIKEMILFNSSSISDSFRDIYRNHIDTKDSPHPNLYYTLFRLWFTGIKTSNPIFIMRWGCILNILFFIISYFAMFFLLLEIADTEKQIISSLVIAFANPITVSSTIFLRPYALQETFLILFSLCFIKCVKYMQEDRDFSSVGNFLSLAVITSLFMLTQYFSLFYIAMLGLILLVMMVCYKKNNYAPFFICMVVVSLIFCKLFYRQYGVMGGRKDEVVTKYTLEYLKLNIGKIVNTFNSLLHKNSHFLKLGLGVSLLYLFGVLFFSKSKQKTVTLCLFFTALVFSLLVLYSAPYKVTRYFSAAVPLYACIFVICFRLPKLKQNTLISLILNIIVAVCLVISVLPISINENNIEHLDDSKLSNLSCINEPEKNIVVYTYKQGEFGTLLPYLKDEHKVYFVKDMKHLNNLDLTDDYYLLISKNGKEKVPNELTIIHKETDLPYFTELLIRKN